MIFCLRTDSALVEMSLVRGSQIVASLSWQADRSLAKDLLSQMTAFLQENDLIIADLTGIVVYKGSGSFTGLRIGCTVMNTIAYAQHIPIVGESGDAWRQSGCDRLAHNEDDRSVMPEYGSEPRVTRPRK